MNNKQITNTLNEELEKKSCKGKMVSTKHVQDLKVKIEKSHKNGLFDEEFYCRELINFNFDIPENFPKAKSLIIVAVPQPHVCLTFHPNGKPFLCLLPSTYSHKTDDRAKKIIELVLKPKGFNVENSKLPLKSLAVHSGLARYGRNNISYVEGMGSFFRLAGFYSDFPCTEDNWGETKIMERCETCTICQKMCPTEAIPSDRFLLRAERCISFFSEWPGDFPDWLDPSWHHCLVGCLLCQKTCPVNKDFVNNIERGVTFSQKETELILRETPENKLPQETLEKLKRLDVAEYLGHLGRNLQILIENQMTH
jgi:epoxyqueuosine reductase